MRFVLIAAWLAALFAAPAQATTWRQTFDYIDNLSSPALVQLFDPALGELESVAIHLEVMTGASFDLGAPADRDCEFAISGTQIAYVLDAATIEILLQGTGYANEGSSFAGGVLNGTVDLLKEDALDGFKGQGFSLLLWGPTTIEGPGTPFPSFYPSGSGYIEYNYAAAGAVPEPESWAMLIVGFGLVGGALRGRRGALGALSRA